MYLNAQSPFSECEFSVPRTPSTSSGCAQTATEQTARSTKRKRVFTGALMRRDAQGFVDFRLNDLQRARGARVGSVRQLFASDFDYAKSVLVINSAHQFDADGLALRGLEWERHIAEALRRHARVHLRAIDTDAQRIGFSAPTAELQHDFTHGGRMFQLELNPRRRTFA